MLTISRNKFIWLCVSAALSLFEYIFLWTIDSTIDCSGLINMFRVLILLNLFFQIVIAKNIGIKLFSPFFLFIVFYYIFHFGQVLMTGIYEFDYMNYLTTYMIRNMAVLVETLKISLNVINITFLGGCCYVAINKNNIQTLKSMEDVEKVESKKIYTLGICLFLISSPFRFFIDFKMFVAAMLHGYSGAYSISFGTGVITALASFWYSSILFMYIGKRDKTIFWAGIAYTVISMLTGNRGHQVTNILIMLLTYIVVEKIKFKFTMILKYGLMAYGMLVFIDMIMEFRGTSIQNFFSNFGEYFKTSLQNNIIFETIGTFGETLYTPFLVIEQMGHQLNPFFGEAWICSLATVLIDIGGIFSGLYLRSNYPKMMDSYHAIGGSYAGDLFYNFRSEYGIIGFLIGIVLCKASVNFIRYVRNRQYSKLIYSVPIFINAFWWIRDSFGNIFRGLIWQIALSYLIIAFMTKCRWRWRS